MCFYCRSIYFELEAPRYQTYQTGLMIIFMNLYDMCSEFVYSFCFHVCMRFPGSWVHRRIYVGRCGRRSRSKRLLESESKRPLYLRDDGLHSRSSAFHSERWITHDNTHNIERWHFFHTFMAFLTGSLWIDDFRGMISRKKNIKQP